MNDKIEGALEWGIWCVMVAALLWILSLVIKAVFMVLCGSWTMWLMSLLVPIGLVDILLLYGMLLIGMKSWR